MGGRGKELETVNIGIVLRSWFWVAGKEISQGRSQKEERRHGTEAGEKSSTCYSPGQRN